MKFNEHIEKCPFIEPSSAELSCTRHTCDTRSRNNGFDWSNGIGLANSTSPRQAFRLETKRTAASQRQSADKFSCLVGRGIEIISVSEF